MGPDQIRRILLDLSQRRIDIEAALARLKTLPFEDLGFARVDHHRELRCGFPEVVFGENKPPSVVCEIFTRLAATGQNVLATRVRAKGASAVLERFPTAAYD